MATVTGNFSTATPRLAYEGVTVARGQYVANGVTVSASDTYLMVKVPNGATIIDGYIAGTHGAASFLFKAGIVGDEAALGLGMTLSATAQLQRFNRTLPYKVSLSDDAVPQWAWVTVTPTSRSVCVTASINLVVTYAAPGAI